MQTIFLKNKKRTNKRKDTHKKFYKFIKKNPQTKYNINRK